MRKIRILSNEEAKELHDEQGAKIQYMSLTREDGHEEEVFCNQVYGDLGPERQIIMSISQAERYLNAPTKKEKE